jgi:DNA polymerase-1
MPPVFGQQMPLIYDMCKLAGWHLLQREKYEADDLIATVSDQVAQRNLRGAIFTTDKDIISRVSPTLGIFKKEKGKAWVMLPEDYTAKWGVPPDKIPEVLILTGDSVDNIPGLKGVGKTTAVKLIQEYGSVANLYANLEKLPAKLQGLLNDGKGMIDLSRQLIQLKTDTVFGDEIFAAGTPDIVALKEFFLKLDMVKTAESLGKCYVERI